MRKEQGDEDQQEIHDRYRKDIDDARNVNQGDARVYDEEGNEANQRMIEELQRKLGVR